MYTKVKVWQSRIIKHSWHSTELWISKKSPIVVTTLFLNTRTPVFQFSIISPFNILLCILFDIVIIGRCLQVHTVDFIANKNINIWYNQNLPHRVKTQSLHFRFHASYFPLPWKISEEVSRRSMLFHNLRQYLPY